MKLYGAMIFLTTLWGCSPSEQQAAQNEVARPVEAVTSDRIKVTRLSVIRDDSAYSDKRATFLIVDTETGKEFIGVSGVGIAETGSHSCGKGCTKRDER